MTRQTRSKGARTGLEAVLSILTARFRKSALILVTAAEEEDDSSLLATSITQLVQGSGRRAICVWADAELEEGRVDSRTSLRAPNAALASREAFDDAAKLWQSQYDFVFVEARNLLATTLVLHIATKADGVLIAMSRGRSVSAHDRDTGAILKQLGASTIGVVMTRPRSSLVGAPLNEKVGDVLPTIASANPASSRGGAESDSMRSLTAHFKTADG